MDIQATPADIERLLSQSDWLAALARKLVGDAATADDLVQDTWIAALQNPPDPDRPVRPWLAGILRRVASMRARAEGRRSWRQRRAARKDELPSAASLVGEVDLQQRLSREVLELDEPYRTTLLLRYFHDLPAVEIARRQGIPAGTVRWRLKRGLDDLRGRLDRSFGDRRSWCLALAGLARREPAAGATGTATTVAASAAILTVLGLGTWALVDRGRIDDGTDLPRVAELQRPVDAPRPAALELAELGARRVGTTAAEAESPGSLNLRIVEPRGHATAELHAVALHADGTVTEARSDANGFVRFPGRLDGGGGVLWVDRPGSFIAPVPFTHAPELQELRLPDGVEFTGRALHAGTAVPAGFVVEIDSDRMLPWGPLPKPVAAILGFGRRAETATDEQGRFAFHSLPAEYTGELWVPAGWRLAEHAPLGADGPRHDKRHVSLADVPLLLEVGRMPAVRGTVQVPTRAAAAGARVELSLRWAGGGSGHADATTDERGGFHVELARADLLHLRVTIEHEAGLASVTRRRRPNAPPLERLDLGTLALSDRPADLLEVRGPDGPIADAWLWFGGAGFGPSGEDGRLEVPAPSGSGWVAAAGHRSGRVRWNAGAAATVVLEPVAALRLKVLDGRGAPQPGFSVRKPAADEDEGPPGRLLALTESSPRVRDGRVIASADGWLDLVDLPVGEAQTLELLDTLGRPLEELTLPPLGPGERREVEHRLAFASRRLAGRCLEESGDVLLGVILDFETPTGESVRVRTDTEGRFELTGLAPEPVTARVGKRGFLSRRIVLAPVESGWESGRESGHLEELRLERACDGTVVAVDAEGLPHERLELTVRRGGLSWTASETAPGDYTFHDLPCDRVVLEWSRSGVSGSVEWSPSAGPAELEIGPGGATIRAR